LRELNKFIKSTDNLVNYIVYILLIIFLLFGGYSLWDMFQIYNGTQLDQEILKYRPGDNDQLSLEELQKINPDICGWIRIDNTKIDYPIVQGKDNYEYLNLDYTKQYSLSGSIFLDYRNDFNFKDNYNIIYGHNVNGNLMFADVKAYDKKWFFDSHQTGHLFTKDKTYKLDVYAYIETNAYSVDIYNIGNNQHSITDTFKEFVKKNSKRYKEIEINKDDKLVALSTCYGKADDRSLIMTKVVK